VDQQQAKELLEKYKSGQCTANEKALVENWITSGEFPDFIISEAELDEQLRLMDNALPLYKEKRLWPRMAVAAAVAATVFSVGLFYYPKYSVKQAGIYAQDITPGKTGATLTLANGKKIRLADAVNGEIAKEAGIVVTKTANGQLQYEIKPSSGTGINAEAINTLSTTRGETYVLMLPDKSKVWLNAASSLTYTVNLLDHGVRKVKLQGEAYFEIFKDKSHPFVVSTANQEVEVLGTHFNINSYSDEKVTTTTLLEGSVKVSKGHLCQTLKPNQQSLLTSENLIIKNVSAQDAIAWKEGAFLFDEQPLESIMRTISRWYNIDIEYANGVDKNRLYSGGISKYNQVSAILEMLEATKNVHFKMEGRKILVMK